MTIQLLCSRVAMFLACALPTSFAFSIASYSFQQLPDLGSGGRALGIGENKTMGGDRDFNDAVVGFVNNGSGGTTATVWKRTGGVWTASYLPSQGISNGRAYEGWLDETSLGTVSLFVGEAQDGSGTDNANMWVSLGNAPYTRYLLPTLGGANGSAVSLVRTKDQQNFSVLIAGTTQMPNGDFHATLWHVRLGFPIETYDLGTLGGANSELVRVHDDGEIFVGAGRAQTATGEWHACVWRIPSQGGYANSQIEDRHPVGVTSVWSDASGHFDFVAACGATFASNGRSLAGLANISSPLGAWTPLRALNATNTAATAIANTKYGNLTFGQAWDDLASRVSVVWNTVGTSGRTAVYSFGAIGEGASDVNALMGAARASGAVGSFFDDTTGSEKACVLVANGTQLPDVVTASTGTQQNRSSETNLWRVNDGKTLQIKPGQGSKTTVEVKWEGPDFDASSNIVISMRARISGNANASAKGVVEIFNYGTSQWDSVGTGSFFDIWTDMVVTATAAAHLHPQTGSVRVRANFTPLAGSIRAFEVDSLNLNTVPVP